MKNIMILIPLLVSSHVFAGNGGGTMGNDDEDLNYIRATWENEKCNPKEQLALSIADANYPYLVTGNCIYLKTEVIKLELTNPVYMGRIIAGGESLDKKIVIYLQHSPDMKSIQTTIGLTKPQGAILASSYDNLNSRGHAEIHLIAYHNQSILEPIECQLIVATNN